MTMLAMFGRGAVAGSLPLAATLDNTTLSGYTTGYGTCTTNTASSCAPAGGIPSYTYLWTRVSGSTDVLPDSPTAFATTFSVLQTAGTSATAVYKCVVTDSAATAVDSNTVTVTLENIIDFGGGIIP